MGSNHPVTSWTKIVKQWGGKNLAVGSEILIKNKAESQVPGFTASSFIFLRIFSK